MTTVGLVFFNLHYIHYTINYKSMSMHLLLIMSCIHTVAPSPIQDDPDSLQYLVTFTSDFTPILHVNFTVSS